MALDDYLSVFAHGFHEVPHLHGVGTLGKLAVWLGQPRPVPFFCLVSQAGLSLALSLVRLHVLISTVLRFFLFCIIIIIIILYLPSNFRVADAANIFEHLPTQP